MLSEISQRKKLSHLYVESNLKRKVKQLETNRSDPSLSFRDSHSRQEKGGLNILIFTASWDITIHTLVPRPAASVASGILSEMQNLSPHPRHIQSEFAF